MDTKAWKSFCVNSLNFEKWGFFKCFDYGKILYNRGVAKTFIFGIFEPPGIAPTPTHIEQNYTARTFYLSILKPPKIHARFALKYHEKASLKPPFTPLSILLNSPSKENQETAKNQQFVYETQNSEYFIKNLAKTAKTCYL